MKKNILITTIIGIVLIVVIVGAYIYLNPEKPEPTTGDFITTTDLYSFCGLQTEKTCNIPMPCEGETVDVIGYNMIFMNELRGLKGTGMAHSNIQIIYLDENIPKDSKEYMDIGSNNFWTGISITEDEETQDSSVSAQALKEKLDALGVEDNVPIIVKVKNAKIVGYDMPINSECSRGIGLQASYKDITFEKAN
ncbi:MAG: hypothetical protein V1889_01215 [archaeon]